MAEIESIVEPNSVLDNYGWKSKSFVNIWVFHLVIVTEFQLTCQYRYDCSPVGIVRDGCKLNVVWISMPLAA